jgi:hypothetical protein
VAVALSLWAAAAGPAEDGGYIKISREKWMWPRLTTAEMVKWPGGLNVPRGTIPVEMWYLSTMQPAYTSIESEFATPEQACAYEDWLRAKVSRALAQAENPAVPRYSTDEVRQRVFALMEKRSHHRSASE